MTLGITESAKIYSIIDVWVSRTFVVANGDGELVGIAQLVKLHLVADRGRWSGDGVKEDGILDDWQEAGSDARLHSLV